MTIHTLASGSEGNCLLLSDGDVHLLLDAGISTRRIKTGLLQLGLTMADVDGVLITHEHSDHVSGLQTMVKHHRIPIYTSPGTARQLAYRIAGIEPLLRPVEPGTVFSVGDCRVTVFRTSHDAAQSVDYRVDGSASVGFLTDTGYVTPEAETALAGVDTLVLESNHDVEWLRSGPYPYSLKARILGDEGHLSNDAAAEFAARMARCGTRCIVLAHLSRENNTPPAGLGHGAATPEYGGGGGTAGGGSPQRGQSPLRDGGTGMQRVTVLCVGKLKEKFYLEAAAEYVKRLQRFCKLELVELPESRLPESPSPAEVQRALAAEAAAIRERLPKGGAVIALCIEGKPCSSVELSRRMEELAVAGKTQLTFLIGGSVGLDESLKRQADWRLSMSPMTFPHHLARIMLLEQIYRAYQISAGTKYHK